MIIKAVPAVADLDPLVREICTWVPEKCSKQPVLTANRKLKYLSSHLATDLYIARNATRTIDQRDNKYRLRRIFARVRYFFFEQK